MLLETMGSSNTPKEAAECFAANAFEEPRKHRNLKGYWIGKTFQGTFNLVGGRQVYLLSYHPSEGWAVAADLMR